MKQKEIKVLSSASEDVFENHVNILLGDGWQILSASAGFVNSEKYDFCSVYQAILVRYDDGN